MSHEKHKFWRATYGTTYYCGGSRLEVKIVLFTFFYRPAGEAFMRGEFDELVADLAGECGEDKRKRGYSATPVASSDSRGLGFNRLAYLLDGDEQERFDLRRKGRIQ